MKLCNEFICTFEVLIVLKLTELSCSFLKVIIHTLHISIVSIKLRALHFERKMKSELKLNSKHLFKLTILEINAV